MDHSSPLSARAGTLVPKTSREPFTLDTNPDNLYSGLLLLSEADTLLYIDPPPQTSCVAVLPRSSESIPHRIHSQRLLDTGSAYFNNLFQPRTQVRTISHRGLEGKLTDGIKYVIDLTPPSVDEDAVLYLTELSCPLSIRNWADSSVWWNLPIARSGGEDEIELPGNETESTSASSKPGLPVEYSVSRHRSGIEHLICALEGYNPRLDTPCKLWTFFALARLFEVATVPKISNIILSWLYDSTNVNLIECHPEVAYKIGCGVQCDYLCRDSFSILVGEEALLLLANSDKQPLPGRPQWTYHGRLREPLLDDNELQRIEYASKSFVEYVIDRFIYLAGSEMQWLFELSTFQELLKFTPETPSENVLMSELIITCKEYVRARIVQWLEREKGRWVPTSVVNTMDTDSSRHYKYTRGPMRYPERVFSRSFWWNIMCEQFDQSDFQGISSTSFWNSSVASLGDWLPAFETHATAKIKAVTQSELSKIVHAFNSLVQGDNHGKLDYQVARWGKEDDDNLSIRVSGLVSYSKGQFALNSFIKEVRSYVNKYARDMVQLSRSLIERPDTLMCLTENEFKYLPLWAGGNDDGTGGVFMDHDIPILEAGGFSAPGPEVHLGSRAASTADSISIVSTREIESTVQGASHRTTNGYGADMLSIKSMTTSSQKDNDGVGSHQKSTSIEGYGAANDYSFLLNSSADDVGSFACDSDGGDTVIMEALSQSDEFSDFEELDLERRS
ncbi:hypothetical protein BDV28DRAFT_126146 [Aspergillus coremiiformis]|uniref:BTB domain-containing protein n=1 Tax=Aspergillus coremiiformis TaxID=138285 RepID=A0A5N6ZHA4_9EURO|nr:hypothetical protein BDV28DRAFT_126146 [Aspergillus coremiiformis]